jgi:Flp pilus assembly protein TadG
MMAHSARTETGDRDRGFVGSVEVVYLGIAALVAVVFLGYLGRLAASGIQVTNAAQDAARAASLAADPAAAQAAAQAAVQRSGLPERCIGDASASFEWTPSDIGSWRGASVTVSVTCTVSNQSLTGVWSPGNRTITTRDTQIVEPFRQ